MSLNAPPALLLVSKDEEKCIQRFPAQQQEQFHCRSTWLEAEGAQNLPVYF